MRFDSISPRRHGCRLPHESPNYTGSGAGPVTTYKLSPEELAKYGPVSKNPRHRNNQEFDRHIRETIQSSTGATEAAKRLKWPLKRLRLEITKRKIKPPWKDDGQMKLRVQRAAEKLPKEKLIELKAAGKRDREIYEEYGIQLNTFYDLKEEYGLVEQISPPCEGVQQLISDKNPPISDDNELPGMNPLPPENEPQIQPVWAVAGETIVRVSGKGLGFNTTAMKQFEERGVKRVQVGVVEGKVIIKPDAAGQFKIGRVGGRRGVGGAGRTGGKALGKFMQDRGVQEGKYRLAWNEAQGWFETGDEKGAN